MLLRISLPATDWIRLASTLEAAGSPVLVGILRTMASVAAPATSDVLALQLIPEQAGGLQTMAACFGLRVPVTPVAPAPNRTVGPPRSRSAPRRSPPPMRCSGVINVV